MHGSELRSASSTPVFGEDRIHSIGQDYMPYDTSDNDSFGHNPEVVLPTFRGDIDMWY